MRHFNSTECQVNRQDSAMSLEIPEIPDLPVLPEEIRQAVDRTFTYANEDETVHATTRGDQTLITVDVQVYEDADPEQIAEGITFACRAALDEALESLQAEMLASGLIDDELRAALLGQVEPGQPAAPRQTYEATVGSVTAVVDADTSLQRIFLAGLEEPERIGPDTVSAVNDALQQARGADQDDVTNLAEQRLAELGATMDRLSATLDPLSRRLDEISRSLDQA